MQWGMSARCAELCFLCLHHGLNFLMLISCLKQIGWFAQYCCWQLQYDPQARLDCCNRVLMLFYFPIRNFQSIALMDNDILHQHDNSKAHLLFYYFFFQWGKNTGVRHHFIPCLAWTDSLNIGNVQTFMMKISKSQYCMRSEWLLTHLFLVELEYWVYCCPPLSILLQLLFVIVPHKKWPSHWNSCPRVSRVAWWPVFKFCVLQITHGSKVSLGMFCLVQ